MLSKVIPSRAYNQYADDADIQALFASINLTQQDYLDFFNAINLPYHPGTIISGSLLDLVGNGLYNIARPNLFLAGSVDGGFQTQGIGGNSPLGITSGIGSPISQPAFSRAFTDDEYKRVLTWQTLRQDGPVYTIANLKRKCLQFLFGQNGVALNSWAGYVVSVGFVNSTTVQIVLNVTSPHQTFNPMLLGYQPVNTNLVMGQSVGGSGNLLTTFGVALKAAIDQGILDMPSGFVYNVVIR